MISESKLHQSEIVRYRLLILNTILAYPIWGYLLKDFETDLQEPFWIRTLISCLGLTLLGGSFFIREKRRFLEWSLVLTGWMIMGHTVWVSWINNLQFSVFCSFLIFLCSLLNIFPTKRSSWLLAFAAATFGAVVALAPVHWLVSPVIVNVALWSAIVPSLAANYTRIRHLSSLIVAQEELSTLFENIKEGLVVLNPEGQIIGINQAAGEIFDIGRNKILGSRFDWNFLTELGRPLNAEENPLLIALKNKDIVRDVVLGHMKSDGGIIWLKASTSPFSDSDEVTLKYSLITFSDITEVKKTQKTILEQQARIDANLKFTALGEMAAGIAHEINNPLAIISGKIFLIQKGMATQKFVEPVEKSLEKIKSTIDRIQRIVRGLQTFSLGGDQDPFQKVSLNSVIEEALVFCQEKIDKRKVQIQLEIEQDLVLECRPVQLSQCLINLISNSCDAIEQQSERWIRIWARSAHNMAVLKITDSGNGIPIEIQKKLMQPFFTTKEVGRGTGLGLSITRGLIQSHLGKLWLDTHAKHTTFVIELPLEHVLSEKAS